MRSVIFLGDHIGASVDRALRNGSRPEGSITCTLMKPTDRRTTTLDQLIEQYCTVEWKQLMRDRNVPHFFRKGQHVFEQGQVAEHIYMVDRGGVKVTATYKKEREQIVRIAGPGEVVGHRALGSHLVYTARGTALMDTRLNSIPISLFSSVLRANNLFCYQFLLFFAEEMQRLDRRQRDMMTMDVTQRVAKVLKMDMDSFGFDSKDSNKLAFTLSRQDIANAAGTTYESVIRTLAALQRRRIIGLEGKEIRILNKATLLKVLVQ